MFYDLRLRSKWSAGWRGLWGDYRWPYGAAKDCGGLLKGVAMNCTRCEGLQIPKSRLRASTTRTAAPQCQVHTPRPGNTRQSPAASSSSPPGSPTRRGVCFSVSSCLAELFVNSEHIYFGITVRALYLGVCTVTIRIRVPESVFLS